MCEQGPPVGLALRLGCTPGLEVAVLHSVMHRNCSCTAEQPAQQKVLLSKQDASLHVTSLCQTRRQALQRRALAEARIS